MMKSGRAHVLNESEAGGLNSIFQTTTQERCVELRSRRVSEHKVAALAKPIELCTEPKALELRPNMVYRLCP